MLVFVDKLKEVVHTVKEKIGDKNKKLIPPAPILQKLRSHALKIAQVQSTSENSGFFNFIQEEFINEGFFEEGVIASIIFLNKLGIAKRKEVEGILKAAIEKRILAFLERKFKKRNQNIDDMIIDSTVKIWEDGGSETTRLYNIAQHKSLISWDYKHNRWNVTNLGHLFLELKAFHAICLLLTIDISLNIETSNFRHIPRGLLQALLKKEPEAYYLFPRIHHLNLQWMGIAIFEDEFRSELFSLTILGEKALRYVLSKDNIMLDTVSLLLQSEEQGITYSGLEVELNKLENVLNSPLIDEANKKSIDNAIKLSRQGNHIDGIKILFPSIENIINKMLTKTGKKPKDYKGWRNKIEYLKSKNIIPSEVVEAIEIITSRNKILHGQFAPLDQEYAYPLFQMSISYMHRIINAWNFYSKQKCK